MCTNVTNGQTAAIYSTLYLQPFASTGSHNKQHRLKHTLEDMLYMQKLSVILNLKTNASKEIL